MTDAAQRKAWAEAMVRSREQDLEADLIGGSLEDFNGDQGAELEAAAHRALHGALP